MCCNWLHWSSMSCNLRSEALNRTWRSSNNIFMAAVDAALAAAPPSSATEGSAEEGTATMERAMAISISWLFICSLNSSFSANTFASVSAKLSIWLRMSMDSLTFFSQGRYPCHPKDLDVHPNHTNGAFRTVVSSPSLSMSISSSSSSNIPYERNWCSKRVLLARHSEAATLAFDNSIRNSDKSSFALVDEIEEMLLFVLCVFWHRSNAARFNLYANCCSFLLVSNCVHKSCNSSSLSFCQWSCIDKSFSRNKESFNDRSVRREVWLLLLLWLLWWWWRPLLLLCSLGRCCSSCCVSCCCCNFSFNVLISSRSCCTVRPLVSSLTLALLVINLARCANFNVDNVSFKEPLSGLTLATMEVLLLPPKLSFKRKVNLLSR